MLGMEIDKTGSMATSECQIHLLLTCTLTNSHSRRLLPHKLVPVLRLVTLTIVVSCDSPCRMDLSNSRYTNIRHIE